VTAGVVIEEVSVTDTMDRLSRDASAVLVDVRTKAEWAFVGVPDLSKLGKRPFLVEWQTFPDNRIDPNFVEHLLEALNAAGANQQSEVFFICRSGGRSLMAARALASVGYARCRNVVDGFEGPLDPQRHRGTLGGWKAAGLPWLQG
jgi:rhodanese-related sulfurtransferase